MTTIDTTKRQTGGAPMFSVLVPTYNQAQYLPDCLGSLLKQTFQNWEAVIVNDGSTDHTTTVLNEYELKDARFRVFHKRNGGVASALNEGLKQAKGEWILWLSSDDLFEPDKMEIHLKEIGANSKARFFHTACSILDDVSGHKTMEDMETRKPAREWETLMLFYANYVNGISIAVHREVFDHAGNFSEEYKCGQDFDLWLKASAQYRLHFIDHPTCVTRVYPSQITTAYPERGNLDAGRACVDFLNRHEFSYLFPALDLANPENTGRVIDSVIEIIKAPGAYVVMAGGGQALADRMREWLHRMPENWLQQLKPQLDRMVLNAKENAERPDTLAIIESLTQPFEQYERRDTFMEITKRMEWSTSTKDFQTALMLCRYLMYTGNILESEARSLASRFSAAGLSEQVALKYLFNLT